MKKTIKVQCPAKINLTLKVENKRADGYHNINSVMQTISLFDYLTITVKESDKTEIILDGDSKEIPYNEKNLVYKACKLYLNTIGIKGYKIEVYIQKNIPVAAGLAGGSTDAAGMLYGLNKLFDEKLDDSELHELCAKLGSDLNVCLKGGKLKTSGRGEVIEPFEFEEFNVSLIKPRNLGISAKEAYEKFSEKEKDNSRENYVNDLEWAIIDDYEILQQIKKQYPKAIMSGSGSTYYAINMDFNEEEGFWIQNNLTSIPYGIIEV